MFLAALRASGDLIAIFGISWLVEMSSRSLPSSPYGVFSVCICVQLSSFHKDSGHIGLELTLTKLPYYKQSHIPKGLGFQHMNVGVSQFNL